MTKLNNRIKKLKEEKKKQKKEIPIANCNEYQFENGITLVVVVCVGVFGALNIGFKIDLNKSLNNWLYHWLNIIFSLFAELP